MGFDPEKHHRRSIRLKDYDYSQEGAYFVTICVYNGEHLFGDIVGEEMRPNPFGRIVQEEWLRSAQIRREVDPDEFRVMPNHVHGIVIISGGSGAQTALPAAKDGRPPVAPTSGLWQRRPAGPARKSLGAFVAGFKSAVTGGINRMRATPGAEVWQRDFFEHVVRDDESLNAIREYIINNPAQWAFDRENREGTRRRGTRRWEV
jgi:REP element-mobilizing transposase RayT